MKQLPDRSKLACILASGSRRTKRARVSTQKISGQGLVFLHQ
jgi:hypothetical protein